MQEFYGYFSGSVSTLISVSTLNEIFFYEIFFKYYFQVRASNISNKILLWNAFPIYCIWSPQQTFMWKPNPYIKEKYTALSMNGKLCKYLFWKLFKAQIRFNSESCWIMQMKGMLWRIVSRLFQMTPVTIELKTKSMRFSVNFSKSSRICQYLIWIPRPFSGSSSIPSFLITLRIFHKSFAGTFSFFSDFYSIHRSNS